MMCVIDPTHATGARNKKYTQQGTENVLEMYYRNTEMTKNKKYI